MSFGNRSSYASLKDAYGITQFEEPINTESYTIKKEEISQQPAVVVESFSDNEVTCEMVKAHCENCGCMKGYENKAGNWLNEILNLILVGLLLWILVYKPVI